jgi:small nuclear ribonucleoprotein (snRNP)-like protein
MVNEWVNKKVKVSLSNGMYYKGLVLSEGEDYIRLRDIKNNIVFIKFSAVDVIEEWRG